MKLFSIRPAQICLVVLMSICSSGRAMTLQLPSDREQFVSAGSIWRFFRGRGPAGTPVNAWTKVGFDDSKWETGAAGFGFGDGDDATILSDMQGGYVTGKISERRTPK